MKHLKVAVQGCGHGELNSIYQSLNSKVDLLIITGDFQALRSKTDLANISVPPKYKTLGDFHKYYYGIKEAPVMTIFIGGNHESSSYLQELKFGGWVAKNIYYLGEFGVVWYKGLRIGGISGIYNFKSYQNDDEESLPYNGGELRSVYHVRSRSIAKMMSINNDDEKLDILITHDWPQGIVHYGDLSGLLKRKPFFKDDIDSGHLGSPVNRELLNYLKPRYYFASHLHVRFEAIVNGIISDKVESDEIDLDMDMDASITNQPDIKSSDHDQGTYFLALDKCGRNRKHLEIIKIETNADHISYKSPGLYYDNRCLASNKVIENYRLSHRITGQDIYKFNHEVDQEVKNFTKFYQIPENFKVVNIDKLDYYPNNQTLDYVKKFDIPYTEPTLKQQK